MRRNCVVCRKPEDIDILISNSHSHIVKCRRCGFIYDNKAKFVETDAKDIYSDSEEGHYRLKTLDKGINLRRPIKKDIVKNICSFVKKHEGKKILDVGCSIGDLLQLLTEKNFNVYGLDISKKACQWARKSNKKANIFNGQLIDAKYPSNFFDVINISAVMVHVYDPHQLINEACRILKPNGFLFIDDATYAHFQKTNSLFEILTGQKKDYRYFLNFFTIDTFKEFIQQSPFTIIKINKYYYSDKVLQTYVENYCRAYLLSYDKFIEILFLLNRFLKLDQMLNMPRLFQVVLIKSK